MVPPHGGDGDSHAPAPATRLWATGCPPPPGAGTHPHRQLLVWGGDGGSGRGVGAQCHRCRLGRPPPAGGASHDSGAEGAVGDKRPQLGVVDGSDMGGVVAASGGAPGGIHPARHHHISRRTRGGARPLPAHLPDHGRPPWTRQGQGWKNQIFITSALISQSIKLAYNLLIVFRTCSRTFVFNTTRTEWAITCRQTGAPAVGRPCRRSPPYSLTPLAQGHAWQRQVASRVPTASFDSARRVLLSPQGVTWPPPQPPV